MRITNKHQIPATLQRAQPWSKRADAWAQ